MTRDAELLELYAALRKEAFEALGGPLARALEAKTASRAAPTPAPAPPKVSHR